MKMIFKLKMIFNARIRVDKQRVRTEISPKRKEQNS